jgi:prepilin signal peptidase PulO-like enzyme (type II secretory pathway)
MTFLTYLFFFTFGAISASFIGVISERVYTGQSWKKGRSKCNSCRETLEGKDLIPVFSWLLYRGRCRRCKVKLPARYVFFEVLMGVLFALSYLYIGFGLPLILFLIALGILDFIVIYDMRHTVVPNLASNLLIIFALAFSLNTTSSPQEFLVRLVVAAVIALMFYLLYALSKGRAMGLGDTPVAFALSLLVGSAAIPGVMFSFWIGAVVGIAILLARKGGPRMGIEIPFVPFMAAGYLLAYFTLWNPLPFLL